MESTNSMMASMICVKCVNLAVLKLHPNTMSNGKTLKLYKVWTNNQTDNLR